MGKKVKRQKTTAADLPDEILHAEILTRLPIKSVVRFKCVSISWLSIFSDPQFVKDHHTHHSTLNPNEYDYLIAGKGTKLVLLSRYKETKILPSDPCTFLVGSINGLVCLRRGVNFSLWNPAIHQFKELAVPDCCWHVNQYNVGFGYDGFSESFKVVVLSDDLMSAVVYCSGLDVWNEVLIPETVFPKRGYEKSSSTVIVKDCPYWTFSRFEYERITFARAILNEASLFVVKFDAQTYEFDLLPEFQFDVKAYGGEGYEFCHQFVDMHGYLSLIVHDKNCTDCVLEIYYLDEEEGDEEEDECRVWRKMYTIGPLDFYLHGGGWYASLSQGFKYGDEIVFHEQGLFSCIDLSCYVEHILDGTKQLVGTTSTNYEVTCFRYTPTLVYILGMKSVYLTTQSRTCGRYRTPRRLISSLRD